MKGKLIVFEGIDCTGKTTAIREILKKSDNNNLIYNKGIGSDAFIGKISRRFPSTLMFFIELIYSIFSKIKPNLNKGRIILQDRYDISITSYVPLVNKFYNRWIIRAFRRFIVKPDAVIYFHLPLDEHIKRLKKKGARYELILANNPHLIIRRKNEYLKWYDNFQGLKIKIDTSMNDIQQTADILRGFIYTI